MNRTALSVTNALAGLQNATEEVIGVSVWAGSVWAGSVDEVWSDADEQLTAASATSSANKTAPPLFMCR
ncbi:MAG TPA: hypothetical protein DCY82_12780 [Acidimicrobiaceae bacterium]|nr:hypothetical protein [Acidimicrobiaceae bacterium]